MRHPFQDAVANQVEILGASPIPFAYALLQARGKAESFSSIERAIPIQFMIYVHAH